MADVQGQIGDVVGGFFGGTFTIIVWVFLGFLMVVVGGGIAWYYFGYRKKFDITVKIISRRSGEDRIYFDKGAILRDKRNNTDYLKLWNSKVELELPKFKIMHHTNKGDYLEVLRESEKGFRFLTPPKVDDEYLIRSNGKLYPIAKLKQYQIENDLTWILERQKANKSIINPESILMRLLEYAPQILSMAFSFIIIWIVFRYAPELLGAMNDILSQMKESNEVEVIGSLIPLLFGFKWKRKI